MSNKHRTTLYIGVTNNLERRVLEHKLGEAPGFTNQYRLTDLVYFEESELITDAIAREKQLKAWKRGWKLDLIRAINPDMMDLSEGWYDKEMLERRDPECFGFELLWSSTGLASVQSAKCSRFLTRSKS